MIQDAKYLYTFKHNVRNEFMATSIEEAHTAWVYLGDLMFKNLESCHFKQVFDDIQAYCNVNSDDESSDSDDEWSQFNYGETESSVEAPRCSSKAVMKGLQKNMFALITQVSALGEQFQSNWDTMDIDEQSYAYNHLGHILGVVFVDLTGFQATILS